MTTQTATGRLDTGRRDKMGRPVWAKNPATVLVDNSREAGRGCVEWTGSRNASGYGRVNVLGENLAHRLAWRVAHGAIPAGVLVCHRCDNPPCVNPDHLFLGSHIDNAADMVQKGRAPQMRGERSGMAKLTDAQVEEIGRRAAAGETFAEIATGYGVSAGHVSRVVGGKRRHIGAVAVPSRKKVTEATRAEALSLYVGGVNQTEIGRRLGLHSSTVSRLVRGIYPL